MSVWGVRHEHASRAGRARITHVKRLGVPGPGFVLALMIGTQEGTQPDFGYAFRQAIFGPRILCSSSSGVASSSPSPSGPASRRTSSGQASARSVPAASR